MIDTKISIFRMLNFRKKKQFELFVFYLYFIENGIVLHQGDL